VAGTASSHREGPAPATAARRPPLTAGWGWLALLRLGLGVVMGIYALAYDPLPDHPAAGYVRPLALLLAVIPTLTGLVQLTPRFRSDRGLALAVVPIDSAAVFATLALFAFDPRRYLLALVVVAQAEAGAVLGLRGGLAAWVVTSAGYVAVENLSAAETGVALQAAEVGLRLGVGLLVALAGGFLSEELSGERRRRLAERERQLRRLEEAEARYRSLVEQIPAVPYLGEVDPAEAPSYVSPQIRFLAGFEPEEWTSAPRWTEHIHPDDRDRVAAEMAEVAASRDPFRSEYRLVHSDGRVVWVRDESTVVADDHGRPRFRQGVLFDITEQKRAEAQVTYMAYHDALTGLPNRSMFEELLDLALARARRNQVAVAVLYMDLDNFKDVNDTLGHAAGDELLRQMAARLRGVVREADVLARLGGDEFAVLLADLEQGKSSSSPEEPARALARRIQRALDHPFPLAEQELHTTASIGISIYPITARDAGGLMRQADAAMYQSKRSGPGGWMVFAA
jgi:diguanylate cyclase (GGDEF)-like protein/PAS domain S-box-containing protein